MHGKQTTMTESHKACENRSRDPMVALAPSIQFPTRFRIESDIMVPNYIFDKQVCDVGHSCFWQVMKLPSHQSLRAYRSKLRTDDIWFRGEKMNPLNQIGFYSLNAKGLVGRFWFGRCVLWQHWVVKSYLLISEVVGRYFGIFVP